jgi:CheY-like chemotaxis protein
MPTTQYRPARILVVADESTSRAFADDVLTHAGYVVDTASGGAEALTMVEDEGSFDLFVIDVLMPEMRGDELGRELLRRQPHVKVLYFNADADFLFQQKKNVRWENEAFLEHPFTRAELRKAVSLLLFQHTHGPNEDSDDPSAAAQTM